MLGIVLKMKIFNVQKNASEFIGAVFYPPPLRTNVWVSDFRMRNQNDAKTIQCPKKDLFAGRRPFCSELKIKE